MKNSDLSVVCLLDNVNNATNANNVADRLSSYARFDNILGGICEMDPDRYGSGKGKIFWANRLYPFGLRCGIQAEKCKT